MSGYTALPTKNPGDLLTSALWNTYLQGNADSGFCRKIADSTLGSPAATVDFTSLPATFAHLMVVIHARGDQAATQTSLNLRLNGDSGAHYDWFSEFTGSAGSSSAASSGQIGFITAASSPSNRFSPYVLWVPHYAQANTIKAVQTLGFNMTAGGAANITPYANSFYWFDTPAAINELTFLPGSGNLVANSRFTVYGLPA